MKGLLKIKSITGIIAALVFVCQSMHAQDKLYANEFPLGDVKLLAGPFQHARDLNIKVLSEYNVDRLLAGYRKQAGLPEKAKSYPNWDGLDGHIAGHYLSALAMNYAATGNADCKKRMDYMLAELKACQDANGKNNPEWAKGYLGAVPNGEKIWSTFKQGDFAAFRAAWVPFYNIHKMYAGLRDTWLYTGNKEAQEMFLKFCDWGIAITANLSHTQMQSVLDIEHGGMNEIFADAYEMTGNEKYLIAAKQYSHQEMLEPLSKGIDNLDNKHANTQIPKITGFERIAELSHDKKYDDAAAFFWQAVTTKRTLAFGGNSRREHFPTADASIDYINEIDGPESCNSYNMLKLTEDLFRTAPNGKYVDYYERTLFNHILSTQHPEHGGYVYFTSARPNHYRVYSAPGEAMWCCVGSGMENHGKYNQFIYTHTGNSLYLNLFIASELQWKNKKITLRQETNFPAEEQTKLTVTAGNADFNLMVRYPGWVNTGALEIQVNGKKINYTTEPSSYVSINRKWKKGDIVIIKFPMHNSIEYLPNTPQYIAFMHGPILLSAKTGTENLTGLIADDSRFGQHAGGERMPIDKAPVIIDNNIEQLAGEIEPVSGKPLHYVLHAKMINTKPLELEPFYKIHDARYNMYWLALTNTGYKNYLDSLGNIEKEKQAIEKRTVDFVAAGEQQPEADHFIQKQNSNSGNSMDAFWRDARNEGYFSYQLSTNNETGLSLLIKYWGAEWGSRKFDIYIDDEKLITEDNTGKWNQSKFQDVMYNIPDTLINGKEKIRIKFQALPGNTAGAVYYMRLIRK